MLPPRLVPQRDLAELDKIIVVIRCGKRPLGETGLGLGGDLTVTDFAHHLWHEHPSGEGLRR